jgi:serine/threonine-protein kinase
MSELLGKKLLNYRVEKLLGQGGMGEVYLGVHTEIERKVAIKVISPHLAQDERIRERFRREALILSKLNHPNIVQLYDFWDHEKGLFLIMEYVHGISLDRYIHRVVQGPIPLGLAIELFLQILDAFRYAHENGVIHRDIKPSNILIRNDNIPKVLDFGIARILSGDATQSEKQRELTRTGTTIGTVAYMSPEQIKAKSPADVDHRSDIYSLGLVFFEMLTGQAAYDRTEHSEFDLLLKIATEPPPSPLSINAGLPSELDGVFQKMLAKNPKDRYQTCSDLSTDILRIAAQYNTKLATAARRPESPNPALTAATATEHRIPSGFRQTLIKIRQVFSKTDETSSGRKKLWLILAFLILGLITATLLLISYQNRQAQEEVRRVAQAFAEEALRKHDIDALSSLLAENLIFFFDKGGKSQAEIKKAYQDFWASLQKDSVTWLNDLEVHREGDQWIVSGRLYYSYTTKPRYDKVPKKRYNRLWGRYETYYETITTPPQTICKIKTLRLHVSEGKIHSIEQITEISCS